MLSYPHLPTDMDLNAIADQAGSLAGALLGAGHSHQRPGAAELSLAESLPVWGLNRDAKCFVDTGRWQHLIVDRGQTRFVAESAKVQGQWKVRRVSESDVAPNFDRAVADLARSELAQGREPYSMRMLDVLQYQLAALWLCRESSAFEIDEEAAATSWSADQIRSDRERPSAQDLIIVLACLPGHAGIRPLGINRADGFVNELRRHPLPNSRANSADRRFGAALQGQEMIDVKQWVTKHEQKAFRDEPVEPPESGTS